MNHTCLYYPAAEITALWLVFISPPAEGRRLSSPKLCLRMNALKLNIVLNSVRYHYVMSGHPLNHTSSTAAPVFTAIHLLNVL